MVVPSRLSALKQTFVQFSSLRQTFLNIFYFFHLPYSKILCDLGGSFKSLNPLLQLNLAKQILNKSSPNPLIHVTKSRFSRRAPVPEFRNSQNMVCTVILGL